MNATPAIQTACPEPLVSVAMITYNHRCYLEKAVRSVLSQEVDFRFELLLGEDCSDDGTRELAFELQRAHPDRIRLIVSEDNVGAHANLFRVERACRGKYVAYCEGDDFWQEVTKLAKQVAFLEQRPEYVMVHSHCDRYYVRSDRLVRNSLKVPRDLDDGNAYEDMMLGRRYPLTVAVMTKRESLRWILDNCPECTDPQWPMGDTQRWLELARLGKVGCVHESLATTNVLPESAGQSDDTRKRLGFYLAARQLKLHYLEKYPCSEEVAGRVRERLALMLLRRAFDAPDPEAARELYNDYVIHKEGPCVHARLLRWGSQSPRRRRVALPLVRSERLLRSLARRIRFASSQTA